MAETINGQVTNQEMQRALDIFADALKTHGVIFKRGENSISAKYKTREGLESYTVEICAEKDRLSACVKFPFTVCHETLLYMLMYINEKNDTLLYSNFVLDLVMRKLKLKNTFRYLDLNEAVAWTYFLSVQLIVQKEYPVLKEIAGGKIPEDKSEFYEALLRMTEYKGQFIVDRMQNGGLNLYAVGLSGGSGKEPVPDFLKFFSDA